MNLENKTARSHTRLEVRKCSHFIPVKYNKAAKGIKETSICPSVIFPFVHLFKRRCRIFKIVILFVYRKWWLYNGVKTALLTNKLLGFIYETFLEVVLIKYLKLKKKYSSNWNLFDIITLNLAKSKVTEQISETSEENYC